MDREMMKRFLTRYRGNIRIVAFTSILLNVLVFGGSLYMMLVYDSVLPSGSLSTLAGLLIMITFVYVFQGLFEFLRSEALLRIANGVHQDLFRDVHHAATERALKTGKANEAQQLPRDLDQIHTFLAGAGPVAIIDLPWVLVFLLLLAALHWALGLTALFGTVVLAAVALYSARSSSAGMHRLLEVGSARHVAAQAELRFAESALAMGMRQRLLGRSGHWDRQYLDAQSFLSRTVARFGGAGRIFRLFLQSLILTVGAVLVINGQASGGIIIASSVLAGRAFAPVDQAIANWRNLSGAREGWSRLCAALAEYPQPIGRKVELAPPSGNVSVSDIWISPPGANAFVLQGVSMQLRAGQAVAIIGPSAAGKTTLAKAMLGILPCAKGEIRMDGATPDQWDADALGATMGYVPQVVELMDGTVGENIARFDPHATSEAIVAAAKAAGLHDMILQMPNGYETTVSGGGQEFSAGQRQRLGLARALYGDPFLVVLDEPSSNLDSVGEIALADAIVGVRKRGGIVIMVTHRPSALSTVSHIALLRGGRLAEFGERDAVMQRMNQKAPSGNGNVATSGPANTSPANLQNEKV